MPLVTIPSVEIARTGNWSASTGPWNCTRAQLADAVRAYESRHFRAPVMKRGHTDKRFEGDVQAGGDGEPTLGVLRNLRLANGGDSLVADLRVPQWLADDMPATYPSRSIEADLGVETADGSQFQMVVTGLALLGETKPAIQSLDDLPDAEPEPMQYVAAMAVAASIPLEAKWNVVFDESKHKRQGGKFVSKGSGYTAKKDQSPQVRALQRELVRLGFLDKSSGKNGGVDGLFGPKTEAAVRAWQKASGNLATGRVTPALLKTLQNAKKGDSAKQSTANQKKAFRKERQSRRSSTPKKLAPDTLLKTRRQTSIEKATSAQRRATVRAAAEVFVNGLDEDLSVREVLDEAVVYVDADGRAWVADHDEDDDGVEFGELEPVSVTYTPIAASESEPVHTNLHVSEVSSISGLGHPIGSSLGALPVDITPQMREALGVDEQADEAAILAALEKLKSAGVRATTEPIVESPQVETPAVSAARVDQTDRSNAQTESVAASADDIEKRLEAKFEARLAASVGTLTATNQTLADELGKVTSELAARKAAEAVTRRETLLASAVREGKITPADKDHYGAIYDTSPDAAEKLLASRAAYSAVPMQAIGHSGDVEQSKDLDTELLAFMGYGGEE